MAQWKLYPKIKYLGLKDLDLKDLNSKDMSLYKDLNLDEVIIQLLYNRGILKNDSTPEDLKAFLYDEIDPSILKNRDPYKFKDMKRVVTRIKKAVKSRGSGSREKIQIYGDYDVDGICATSILWDFLYNKMKADVRPFIPSRFTDGYGLNKEQIEKASKEGITLIITVDCGIRDVENAKIAKDLGIDLIISDHHLPPKTLPQAYAIVHPLIGYNYADLCGAGVALKIVEALAKDSKYENFDISEYYDLAALATVCDVSNLTLENRTILKRGLNVINMRKRKGLDALISVSEIDNIDVYKIGYILGPKINATGRLYDALDGVRLLNTQSKEVAEKLSKKLHDMNIERQKLTFQGVEKAKTKISKDNFFNLVYDDMWHEGVVGLIAGRLTSDTGKPTIALTKKGDVYIGSGRSVDGFNIVEALDQFSDILEAYGGHAAACGLRIKKENIEKLHIGLNKLAEKYFNGSSNNSRFKNKTSSIENDFKIIYIDKQLVLGDITFDFLDKIKILEPHGRGNSTPIFKVAGAEVLSVFNIGSKDNFVKMKITDKNSGNVFDAVWFSSIYKPDQIINFSYVDIAFTLEDNIWRDKHTLQLKIVDLKPHIV
jgi:single-stranded-DNA-specific exonuclease